MEEQNLKDVLGTEIIMQSLLGRLYDILTMGEKDTPKSEDNFFSWATPGIPVSPDDFEFMTQGLVGKTKPEKLKAVINAMVEEIKKANEGCTEEQLAVKLSEVDAEAVMRELIVQDEHDMLQQAENFARLVDFIPDVSGTGKDGINTYQVMENEGTLSQVYDIVLRYSQVKNTKIDPEVQAVIDEYKKKMIKEVEKPVQPEQKEEKGEKEEGKTTGGGSLLDMLNNLNASESSNTSNNDGENTEEEEGLPMPSDFKRAYDTKETAYRMALIEYNNFLTDSLSSNKKGASLNASRNAEAMYQKVQKAMNDWILLGHKNEYERMANFIEQVEDRTISALKREYKEEFRKSKLTGLSSGAPYYYAQLTPANFATSSGWTEFTFDHTQINNKRDSTWKNFSSELNTKSKFFKIVGHEGTTTKNNNYYELNIDNHTKDIEIKFDMCQVLITRPWFNTGFLNSKFWRFDDSEGSDYKGTMLSDGKRPPTGIMPAYPTAIIFIKNLTLEFSDMTDIIKSVNDYENTKHNYGGGLKLGRILNISANYESDKTKQTTDNKKDYEITKQGIKVPGMQIIGFKCHILGKCPNPNPSITDWI